MKIAIIGSGISGLTTAYKLQKNHDVHVFESEDRIGGHTATIDVDHDGQRYAIDTGFIVYNDWTYPNFIQLLDELGVETQKTEMSFSVRDDIGKLEYGGNNLNSLFAQRRNLLRPTHYKMIREILRFNREAVADLESDDLSEVMTLGQYLRSNRYSDAFTYQYLLPMGCAIWSSSTDAMIDFPLKFFLRFFNNHGLMSVNHRPQWRVLKGGSRSYLEPICSGFSDKIRLNSKIEYISRSKGLVEIGMHDGKREVFDQLVLACHSDQALSLLQDARVEEVEALENIRYQKNDVVLHTDESLLPLKRLAWSSWNYLLRERYQDRAVLSYNMNILQGLKSKSTFCVTLNATDLIDKSRIIKSFEYSHPVFSKGSLRAAAQIKARNGNYKTWYAGAYLGNGFHEDGVASGIAVADGIELEEKGLSERVTGKASV